MHISIEERLIDLAAKRRKLLIEGESLLKEKRLRLNVYGYYDIDKLEEKEHRIKAIDVLAEYESHLFVERSFYEEYHRTFLSDLEMVFEDISLEEKDRLLQRSCKGLHENQELRMRMNSIKLEQNQLIQRLVEIYNFYQYSKNGPSIFVDQNDEMELEAIYNRLESMSSRLKILSARQRQGEIRGKKLIGKFLSFINGLNNQ